MRIVELSDDDGHLIAAAVRMFRGADGIDHTLFLRDPATVALVALEGADVIGWAWGQRERHVCGYSQLLLYEIDVAEPVRRRGVGSSLMSVILEIGRREGHAKVWLFTGSDNTAAKGLYQAMGGVAATADDTGYSWQLT
jgi:ribosomal protein S18 acetylase RimI-like enzyme